MPLLAYFALAGLGYWLWNSGTLGDLFGGPCELDSHMPPAIQAQVTALMNEPHTRAELDLGASMLAEAGFPAAAGCVAEKRGSDE